MFDTNIFNRIVENSLDIQEFSEEKNYKTYAQLDELSNTPDEVKRTQLIVQFTSINQQDIVTPSAVWDVSHWNRSSWPSDNICERLFSRIQELDHKQKKKKSHENLYRDALIAETCFKHHITLVTEDENLRTVLREIGGRVISLKEFLNNE